ncbi:hypothetical protein [Pseudovibrio sp. Ad37]|uniref:hypothetical protein n=1 Tax=Pseudovibrio sp. Ad37 TaxID=989422 RepID=UPI0007AE7947|nr:hypothetical protein [Pseudovibrio sp. Ad37]KZL24259.1 hypothetical protein PsAD37_02830 [Pseudovibrio sp. Ad37]
MQNIFQYFSAQQMGAKGYSSESGLKPSPLKLIDRWSASELDKNILKNWILNTQDYWMKNGLFGFTRDGDGPVNVVVSLPNCGTRTIKETAILKAFFRWLDRDVNSVVKMIEREQEKLSRVPEDWVAVERKRTRRFIVSVGHMHRCAGDFDVSGWSDQQKDDHISYFMSGHTAVQILVDIRDQQTGNAVQKESSLSEPGLYWPSPIGVLHEAISEMRELSANSASLAA